MDRQTLLDAVDTALAGDWQRTHRIVQQDEADPTACWVHAVATAKRGAGAPLGMRPRSGMRRAVRGRGIASRVAPTFGRHCSAFRRAHKIEGDAANSRYWYARTGHDYGQWRDPTTELQAIRAELEEQHG